MTTVTRLGVQIEGLRKSFGKGSARVTVLDDISLEIADGEFIAVVGPSGSGKSTLLNTIAGFIRPDTGRVLVGGEPVSKPGPSRCVVFQEYAIFPWLSVARNIDFGTRLRAWKGSRAERGEIVDHYLALMGLTPFRDALPKTLSGGMRQRVAIARAYAVDPGILLMDEPFAALDAQTREQMQEALLDLNHTEKRTVLFVTHQVEEALYLADRVVVLTSRPTKVREIVEVPWGSDRPHDLKLSPEFIRLRSHIEALLHGSAVPPTTKEHS
ncbi:ABC transporter ATP-binding protein [Agromyces aerolatus]|uniref:ABC transporter ATP-binding protein n=1 Tax=Agromyces sp. LY-1074 TaxID=3074080 RepID=UPI0028592F74|nr:MULTISPECIES: ABC transporter ATP-binding protein [unclassified Agromyces]MDR5700906.1 ABC transporter ATP-binding protein [Agromyces sp. LY-1074]MDR5707433.1 ABC transporter ATP-binding protein [Agromyces sp. LY-1358]